MLDTGPLLRAPDLSAQRQEAEATLQRKDPAPRPRKRLELEQGLFVSEKRLLLGRGEEALGPAPLPLCAGAVQTALVFGCYNWLK